MPGFLTNAPKSLRECVCTPVHVCLHVRDEGEEGGRERKGKGKKGGVKREEGIFQVYTWSLKCNS